MIYYNDSRKNLIEDRADPYSWDNASKEGIVGLGIQFNPVPLRDENYQPILDSKGKQLRVIPSPVNLWASKKVTCQFFQDKEAILQLIGGHRAQTIALRVGMVYNKQGDCVVLRGDKNGTVDTFISNVIDLTLNLKLFEIDLEQVGIPLMSDVVRTHPSTS